MTQYAHGDGAVPSIGPTLRKPPPVQFYQATAALSSVFYLAIIFQGAAAYSVQGQGPNERALVLFIVMFAATIFAALGVGCSLGGIIKPRAPQTSNIFVAISILVCILAFLTLGPFVYRLLGVSISGALAVTAIIAIVAFFLVKFIAYPIRDKSLEAEVDWREHYCSRGCDSR